MKTNVINRKIKKGDTVMVITGKDVGRRGTVEKIIPKTGQMTITGINVVKKHLKPTRKNPHGGIINKIAPIDISNVVIVCPRCSNPSRVGYKIINPNRDDKTSKTASKLRICKKCKESLD